MAMGQPLLRNRTGGWQEQLKPDGINGFDLGETGITICVRNRCSYCKDCLIRNSPLLGKLSCHLP